MRMGKIVYTGRGQEISGIIFAIFTYFIFSGLDYEIGNKNRLEIEKVFGQAGLI